MSSQRRVTHARRRWQLEEAASVEADRPRPGHLPQPQTGQAQDEEGLVPLSVAMDACLVQGVLHQYRCVSKACLGYVCQHPLLVYIAGTPACLIVVTDKLASVQVHCVRTACS